MAKGAVQLRAAGIPTARLDARVLPEAERLFDLQIEPTWVRSLLHALAQTLDYRLAMRTELDG